MAEPPRLEKSLRVKLRKEKKTKEFPEVKVAHSWQKDDVFYAALIRVSSKGAVIPGEIKYYDDDGNLQTVVDGKLNLPMKEKGYEKKVFCPERPGVTFTLSIPAKKKTIPTLIPTIEQERKPLLERLRSNWDLGQKRRK